MKPYSLDMRQKIINTYEAGNTSIRRKVAARFQVSTSTVQKLLKRKRETGKFFPGQAKGGKPSQLFGQEQGYKIYDLCKDCYSSGFKLFLTSRTVIKNRQYACSTRKFSLCGTGILPVPKA
jgi:hypothetical protein